MIDRPPGHSSGADSALRRVFLDANVLFSAAYRAGSSLDRLWMLPSNVALLSSPYAIEEARRNLEEAAARDRLEGLIAGLTIVSDVATGEMPHGVDLAEKDRPILFAAIAAKATHLLTGDRAHFAALFGRRIGGALIGRPADYLRAIT